MFPKVSWLKSGEVQVLSVGDLMFSSDPRLKVERLARREQDVVVWVLKIRQARESDHGLYQCQVSYSLLTQAKATSIKLSK